MVYYNLIIRSDEYREEEGSFQSASYRKHKQVIADGDGTVSISLPSNPVALFINTDKDISVSLNGASDLTVTGRVFMEVSNLSSLDISCVDTDGANVTAIIWGS